MTIPSQPAAILFDLDGTLIDSSPGVIAAFNHALRSVGEAPRSGSEITPWIGYPLQIIFPHFTSAPYDRLRELFLEVADTDVANSAQPLPDVPEVLQELLERGLRMAIVSTKRRLHIEQVVTNFGWGEFFEVLVGADDVTHVKPDPEPFVKAMYLMNIQSDDAVIVGDTENDILPARALGVRSIAVRSPYIHTADGFSETVRRSSPDYFLDRLIELPELLSRLRRSDESKSTT